MAFTFDQFILLTSATVTVLGLIMRGYLTVPEGGLLLIFMAFVGSSVGGLVHTLLRLLVLLLALWIFVETYAPGKETLLLPPLLSMFVMVFAFRVMFRGFW